MAHPSSRHALDRVLNLERELQTPACRADETRLRELIATDFVEVGASGRRWDFDATMAMLREESAENDDVIHVDRLEARELVPGVVQVFWDSDRGGRRARRTSIWREHRGGWQQVYHQGTVLP